MAVTHEADKLSAAKVTAEVVAQTKNGKQVLTDYTGTVPGKAVAAVIPSADDAAGFPTTFSLDGDNRLVSAKITGPFYNGKGPLAYTLELMTPYNARPTAAAFAVTPALVIQGLVWALAIGFIGGLFPAVRAARLPVTEALRGG